jgi:uncharacterized protein (DUF2384 family)
MITKEIRQQNKIFRDIPNRINDTDVLMFLQNRKINWEYVKALKESTNFKDESLSSWLNVSIRTFRSYKKPNQVIHDSIKEHILLLLSLTQHGEAVFGSSQKFEEWLNMENFFFNGNPPVSYLNKITGIRFVDDRLTAMEFGDNI